MKLLLLIMFPFLLFASQLTLYPNNKAYFQTKVEVQQNRVTNFPQTTDLSTIYFIKPHIKQYSFIKKTAPTKQQLLHFFLHKEVLTQDNTKVTLIDFNSNEAIVQEKEKLFVLPIKQIVFPFLPQSLQQKDTLLIQEPKKLPKQLELSYFFHGISYQTHYILDISSKNATLLGYFFIHNTTNEDITADTTTFMVQKKNESFPVLYRAFSKAAQKETMPQESQQATYSLYTLQKRVTFHSKQYTKILFVEQNLSYRKKLQVRLNDPLYLQTKQTKQPTLYLSFVPTQTLPQGKVSCYKSNLFLQNSFIQNTPKQKQVTLKLQQDLFSYIEQTPLEIIKEKKKYQITIAYNVVNTSDETKKITLHIPYRKNEKHQLITQQPLQKQNATTLQTTITLKPHATYQFTITYKGTY